MADAPDVYIQPPRRRVTSGVIVGLFVFAGAILGFLVARHTFQGRIDRNTRCQVNLRVLADGVVRYRNQNQGQFPTDLAIVAKSMGIDAGCPGASVNNITKAPGEWSGYIYVDWSAQPRSADWDEGTYPLIYDGSLANHEGRGIDIVLVNRTVIWDPDARGLIAFAASHPDVRLTMPK